MLAKISLKPSNPSYELLDAPHSLRHQSQCGRQPDAPDTCGPHASGCGMAWWENSKLMIEKRGPDERWDPSFEARVRNLATRAVIGHNRLASPGLHINAKSAHPFRTRIASEEAAFCHNGGVYNLMDRAKTEGVTDSELFMTELAARTNDPSHGSLARVLAELANQWKYTSLTGFLLASNRLHVWRCYDREDSRREMFEKYYTLWVREETDSATIASECVDQKPGWVLMPNRTLASFWIEKDALRQERSSI